MCSTSAVAHAALPAPSASAIDGAGSVETSSVSPSDSSAAAMASAHATVLFPTPPLPPTIVSRACDASSAGRSHPEGAGAQRTATEGSLSP